MLESHIFNTRPSFGLIRIKDLADAPICHEILRSLLPTIDEPRIVFDDTLLFVAEPELQL